jgi:putative Ca2+/H+ antiporter (TMEM165/GDT1 family)
VQATNHVGNVVMPTASGRELCNMLALLAVSFHVPTMPTKCGRIFAGDFWLLALLALWTANFSRSLKIRTGLPYTLTSHNIYTFFQGYK